MPEPIANRPRPRPVAVSSPPAPGSATPESMSPRHSTAPANTTSTLDAQAGAGAITSKTPPSGPVNAALTDQVADLRSRAQDTSDERAWDPNQNSLRSAVNAHRTNTPQEMSEAIDSNATWFEGDLRLDAAGKPKLSHDAGKEAQGLSLDQWLQIGGASGRGLKVDVKELAAIPQLLDALAASGVPQGRIMINVPTQHRGSADGLSVAQVVALRQRFPDAWLALNPTSTGPKGYNKNVREGLTKAADAAGGRVTFPLQWDLASDPVIADLKPHGSVSIWTDKDYGRPLSVARETHELRNRGVDGMVDLVESKGPTQRLEQTAMRGLRRAFGDDPAQGIWDAVGNALPDLRDPMTYPLLPAWGVIGPAKFLGAHGADIAHGAWSAAAGIGHLAASGATSTSHHLDPRTWF